MLSTKGNVTVFGGGDASDTFNFPNNITFAGAVDATGFDIINASGVTLGIDSLTLGVGSTSSIGASGNPLVTNAKSVVATAGSGGIWLRDVGSADYTFTETGGGDVSISVDTGTLTIAGNSTWDTGKVTLTSADDVVVNGSLGTAGGATKGGLVVVANADGSGTQGYTQSTTAIINTTTATGTVSITVNTSGGGTGNAVLGQGRTDSLGFVAVDANKGSILWNSGFVIPDISVVNNQSFISGKFDLKTSGASSSVGTLASPLQINPNKAQLLQR